MILTIDASIAFTSFFVAELLRFGMVIPPAEMALALRAFPLLIGARTATNFFFRLNRWSFRFSGLTDGARIAAAALCGTGLWVLGLYLLGVTGLSRIVLAVELLLSTILMAALRFTPRLAWMIRADLMRARRSSTVKTVILGAGTTGEMLLHDLQRSAGHDYHILGFVDDDPRSWNDVVGGKSVLGGTSDLAQLVQRFEVAMVLIAIPKLTPARLREILDSCAGLKLRFKTLPASYVDLPVAAASVLADLSPVDLLEREEVEFVDREAHLFSADRCQLVAGAAGSIGSEVAAQLLAHGCRRLVLLDINESGLYMLERRFERLYPDRLIVLEVADIRDAARVRSILECHRPADVFHAAALKHVPLMENCPSEAVKTNVVGTRLLAEAADASGAQRFVFMSTDKAVRPSSVMGATKCFGEALIRQMGGRSETRFSVVRFGNVLDSAGSVVPVFREQIRSGGPVTVTHPEVRRFFMTISEAVGLVLRVAYGDYGALCVLEMGRQIRILDLARQMITLSGLVPEVDVKIEFTGLRPGEKLEEELFAEGETVVKRIDRKISVVEGPAPEGNVPWLYAELAQAAASDDDGAVTRLLREAVDHGPSAAVQPLELAEDEPVLQRR